MSPSNNKRIDNADTKEDVLDQLPVSSFCQPEVSVFRDDLVSITVCLGLVPRNVRGSLLADLIEAGWQIDNIDLERGTAEAFQLL